MKFKQYVILTACLFIAIGSISSSYAATEWAFLRIPQGAREISMGETGVSHSGGGTSIWWNPAHIGEGKTDIWAQGYQWLEDGKGSFGGVKFRNSLGGFSVSYSTLNMEGFEVRDRPGDPQGEFSLHQAAFAAGYGNTILKNISLGLIYKVAYESFYGDDLTKANILDAGIHWKGRLLSAGFSANNLDLENFGDEEFPTYFRLGLSKQLEFNEFGVLFAGEGIAQVDDEQYYHFGLETDWQNIFFLRAGYMTGHDSRSLTAGLGLNYNKYYFDFAVSPFENELGTSWRIGLGLSL